MTQLFLLFFEFFKTGLFAVGGGMATLPFLYNMADKYPQWFTRDRLMDMIAVSESTPGPIGVNMATYAGYSSNGLIGATVATVGLVLPSIIVILIVANFLTKFGESFYVKSAFYGIRPAVAAMIAAAGYGIFKYSVMSFDKITSIYTIMSSVNLKASILLLLLLLLTNIKKLKNVHPIFYIFLSAVVGIMFKF